MAEAATTVIKSDLKGNLAPVILGLLLWLPALYAVIIMPERIWQVFLLLSAFFGFVLYWLISFRVSFLPAKLEYKTPFGSAQTLEYKDVTRVSYKVASLGEGRKYSALFVLVIEAAGREPLVINTKPFSTEALHHIALGLTQKCSSAHIDEKVKQWIVDDYSGLGMTWQRRGQLLFHLFVMCSVAGLIQGLARLHHTRF